MAFLPDIIVIGLHNCFFNKKKTLKESGAKQKLLDDIDKLVKCSESCQLLIFNVEK